MNRGEIEEIVHTTVRKLNSGPEACLTNPRVLSFFNMMKDSVNRCLGIVAAASSTPSEMAESYQTVLQWPSSRQVEEVESVMKRYPSVKDAYMYSAVYIVEQTYKKENRQLKLKLPSFQQFLFTFYSQVVSSEPLQRGTYESLQFFEKEMLCCQSFCNALYNSIRTEPIDRQQSVILEQVKSQVSRAPVTTNTSTSSQSPRAPPPKVEPEQKRDASVVALESHIASASRFSTRALSPYDSVSQAVRSVAKVSTTSGSLTEDTLNKHRNKMGQRTSSKVHPAAASAASVKAAAVTNDASNLESESKEKPPSKKESVRVIDLIEHPQKHLADHASSTTSTSSDSDSDNDRYRSSSRKGRDTRDSGNDRYGRDYEREYSRSHSGHSDHSEHFERSDRSDRPSSRDSNPNRRH